MCLQTFRNVSRSILSSPSLQYSIISSSSSSLHLSPISFATLRRPSFLQRTDRRQRLFSAVKRYLCTTIVLMAHGVVRMTNTGAEPQGVQRNAKNWLEISVNSRNICHLNIVEAVPLGAARLVGGRDRREFGELSLDLLFKVLAENSGLDELYKLLKLDCAVATRIELQHERLCLCLGQVLPERLHGHAKLVHVDTPAAVGVELLEHFANLVQLHANPPRNKGH